jgi:hypothetical protein
LTDRASTRVGLGVQEEGDGGRVLITDGEDAEIGYIECAVSDGWLEMGWVELGMEWRRHGLAADAVRLLEDEAVRRWDVRGVRAEVPVGIGLALYFWLRLGYRPEEPVRGERDTMAMVRAFDDR